MRRQGSSLQLCRPLPGAVTVRGGLAAYHRQMLQLCRPLPGAVTLLVKPVQRFQVSLSIVPPPSGGGYALLYGYMAMRQLALQLCRPLPGGGYICAGRVIPAAWNPSIVPPPSGLVQLLGKVRFGGGGIPSIVPPPSGRLLAGVALARLITTPFNCAAPFRGRLRAARGYSGWTGRSFNCAAPFRGRLRGEGGYVLPLHQGLQLCRPLPGAVTARPYDDKTIYRIILQLCRPLPGAVTGSLYSTGGQHRQPSIVPPPSGGGYPSFPA